MSFPGHYQVPREVDNIGVRDISANAYVNAYKYIVLMQDELTEKEWPTPSDISSSELSAFNTAKGNLQTHLGECFADLKIIIGMLGSE